MPEEINGKKIFSLLDVTKSIQKTIAERYGSSYWIKAEMIKLNHYSQSGHCYPDLVEKKEGKVVAQIRSNLWKDEYFRINSNFQRILKEPLRDGIKILFLATIGYHPEHGLSLRILDIDPAFTLGDLEQEKQKCIERLQNEKIFDANKQRQLPLLPQRIAIISVETSKGYADFLQVIEEAKIKWNYHLFHLLFPSILQGDNAISTIISQLHQIRKAIHHFDVVAIVRGGGGDVGLSCYNHYDLAREIALFPLPVLTGIGHSTNETVIEMIAFENAITPTKLAEYLIQHFHDFSVPLQAAEDKISNKVNRLLGEENSKFQSEIKLFRSGTRHIITNNLHDIKQNAVSLSQQSRFHLRNEKGSLSLVGGKIKRGTDQFCIAKKQAMIQTTHSLKKEVAIRFKHIHLTLSLATNNLAILDPENVLKRGYSMTFCAGKPVNSFTKIKEGDLLTTQLAEGSILSVVKSTNKSGEDG